MRRRRSTWRRVLATCGLVVLAVVALWCGGFLWYVGQIPRRVDDPLARTAAIVVLTGGPERVQTGLALLREGRADKLFITGVNPYITATELFRVFGMTAEEVECCIELGHTALDTAGNAIETARWMAEENLTSLRIVTSSYHMPRAKAEFRLALPTATLVPNPVFPEHFKVVEWWHHGGTAKLISSEYVKFVLALPRQILNHRPSGTATRP